jgi:hypothetical protein
MMGKFWKEFLRNPLKTVTFTISNLDDVWEKLEKELAKEKRITGPGTHLIKKTFEVAYHPDYFTVEKLTEKIKSLGAEIEKIESK